MIDVLIEGPAEPAEDPRVSAREWPRQTVASTGATRAQAIQAFVRQYNGRHRTSLSEEDFRFFGPINVTVSVREAVETDRGRGWIAWCVADRHYEVFAPTEDEVRAAFIAEWNSAHDDQDDIADEHVDWHREAVG